jgi:hypothetical protein
MTAPPLLRNVTAIAWSCLLVLLATSLVSLEWSFPYCNSPADGPAYAVYGFPLPYTQSSGTSSLEYKLMPLAWLFDAVVLGGLFFWIVRRALSQVRSRAALVTLALVAGVPAMAWITLEAAWAWQYSFAEWVLTPDNDGGYADLRPVGVARVDADICQPSRFWFGATP